MLLRIVPRSTAPRFFGGGAVWRRAAAARTYAIRAYFRPYFVRASAPTFGHAAAMTRAPGHHLKMTSSLASALTGLVWPAPDESESMWPGRNSFVVSLADASRCSRGARHCRISPFTSLVNRLWPSAVNAIDWIEKEEALSSSIH